MTFSALDAGLAIIETASGYLDLHEVEGNRAWSDPDTSKRLADLMKRTGWEPGWAYCASFVKACYVSAYRALGADPEVVRKLSQKFTPSVMTTYTNVVKHVHRDQPKPGAIGFMQQGHKWQGHAFIVVLASPRVRLLTIEGNTMPGVGDPGRDREGDGIYGRADRRRDFKVTAGLHLLGFLDPVGSEDLERIAENV